MILRFLFSSPFQVLTLVYLTHGADGDVAAGQAVSGRC